MLKRRFLKVFTIYGPGGHFGHVPETFFIKLSPLFPLEDSTFKLDFIGLAVLKKKRVENKGSYIYTPQKNLRTSTNVFPLFNTESLIFKIENIF